MAFPYIKARYDLALVIHPAAYQSNILDYWQELNAHFQGIIRLINKQSPMTEMILGSQSSFPCFFCMRAVTTMHMHLLGTVLVDGTQFQTCTILRTQRKVDFGLCLRMNSSMGFLEHLIGSLSKYLSHPGRRFGFIIHRTMGK